MYLYSSGRTGVNFLTFPQVISEKKIVMWKLTDTDNHKGCKVRTISHKKLGFKGPVDLNTFWNKLFLWARVSQQLSNPSNIYYWVKCKNHRFLGARVSQQPINSSNIYYWVKIMFFIGLQLAGMLIY